MKNNTQTKSMADPKPGTKILITGSGGFIGVSTPHPLEPPRRPPWPREGRSGGRGSTDFPRTRCKLPNPRSGGIPVDFRREGAAKPPPRASILHLSLSFGLSAARFHVPPLAPVRCCRRRPCTCSAGGPRPAR